MKLKPVASAIMFVSLTLGVHAFAPSSPVRPISKITSIMKSARISNTPEQDHGLVPTKEEQEKINDAKLKKNLLLNPPLISNSLQRLFTWVFHRWFGSNFILFGVLQVIRTGTSVQDIVKIDKEIDFNDKTAKAMWFDVKPPGFFYKEVVDISYELLNDAPPLLLNKDTELMEDEDYTDLIGSKIIDPHEAQMKVESPIQCFLKNANAFCRPIRPDEMSFGDESTSVCDLNYLEKYQVQEGTKYRYGGKAYVKDRKIISISGVKEGEATFETKKHIFLSSFAVHVVLVCHANMAHVAIYQKYIMSLTTKRTKAYQKLWKENINPGLLMKALTPRRSSFVNRLIEVLIGPGNSLVGRAVSLTTDSLTLLNIDKHEEYFAMNPEQVIEEIGSCGSTGWNSACARAWRAAQEVVNTICRNIIKEDDVHEKDLIELAMLLWTGTFYHGFIGDFQLDNVNKGNLPFPLTGREHRQTKAYGTLSTTIGVSTMTRTMDMNTLGKYFDTAQDRQAWNDYHAELMACAKETGIEGFTYDGPIYNAIDF